jgi:hypothetical protein
MSEPKSILYWCQFENLLEYAEVVHTKEGRVYFRIPVWFEKMGCGEFRIHEDMPEDLSQFITKAGLGGDNPQIQKPKQ